MEYRFDDALPVLRRTPAVLRALLSDLPATWTESDEGPGTWSPFLVVGHLIHGERTDWMSRVDHILAHGDAVAFPPFDREAMRTDSRGKPLAELLDTFASLRADNVVRLESLGLGAADLDRRGRHPEFGVVTLRQHLATWVVHDLGHLAQIARVMSKRYAEAVGPWRAYLPVLGR